MSRFYVPPENISEGTIHISGKEAHHILDVMRMSEGDQVVVFDGTGKEYTGFIKQADTAKGELFVEVVRVDTPSRGTAPRVTLAQAVPKKGRMDYIVEKATELGVSAIIPLTSERTIVRPDERSAGKKAQRWRAIAVEASKQCGRPDVPEVCGITPYDDVLGDIGGYDLAVIACLSEGTMPLKQVLPGALPGKVIIFIGPEGDFTPEEIEKALQKKCRAVSLGPRVLKSDTAGLFAVSAVNYHYS